MTELLYLTNNYSASFEATVKSVDKERGYIELDATDFHPQGGHQVTDTGRISKDGLGFTVSEVKNNNGSVLHFVTNKEDLRFLNANDTVQGDVDWERRYQLMKTHTAQHLLSAVAKSRFDMDSVDMTIEEDYCFIKLNKSVTTEQAVEIQNVANDFIAQNIRINRSNESGVYMVSIGEIDSRKCGCTHVMSLQEIECVYIYKVLPDKIFFKVGSQAKNERAKHQEDLLNVRQRTNSLSVKELLLAYNQSQVKEKGLANELTVTGKQLLEFEIAYKSKSYTSSNENLVITKRPELDIKSATSVVNGFLRNTSKVVVVICKNETALVFSNVEAVPANIITDIFRFNQSSFKGGGNAKFSQGGTWSHDVQETYDIIESALLEVNAFCD